MNYFFFFALTKNWKQLKSRKNRQIIEFYTMMKIVYEYSIHNNVDES